MPPHLSIVVSNMHPWPGLRPCLESLLPQVDALSAEIVIGDRTGLALPPDASMNRCVRCVHVPGGSAFELRAKATQSARGEIIAWTEDHCTPAPDWCQRLLEAHRRHPDAPACAGAILNGSPDTLWDWANFLATFGTFLPPLDPGSIDRVPPAANIAFKRSILPHGPLETGWIELELSRIIWKSKGIAFDDAARVHHIQPRSAADHIRSHFHNGRATTGLVRHLYSPFARFRRLALALLVPAFIVRSVLISVQGKKNVRGPLLRSLPLIASLALCHGAGEVCGLLFGPGNSPSQLG